MNGYFGGNLCTFYLLGFFEYYSCRKSLVHHESILKISCPAIDIYSEYVERSQNSCGRKRQRIISCRFHEEKKEVRETEMQMDENREGNKIVFNKKVTLELVEHKEEKHDQKFEIEEVIKEVEEAPNNDDKKEKNGEEECEELLTEELNKRVEEFLARINKQSTSY
ncbi:hypothetical protein F8388_010698 [Cannabis sativa]|uniref:Uncharacterized protein n=1 Tax=Cannabis sativa TaxID=3483 RepID=A0A7J6G832_CANSA|nr:hypothetical protein G4B88_031023 [Cannabis sativa]KAF4378259.1 hypothetical protein F8388_010698 [Cannabis sativa]